MIIPFSHETTPGLAKEIEVIRERYGEASGEEFFGEYQSARAYYKEFMSLPQGLEPARRVEAAGAARRLLEIGPGQGRLAFYFADRGYDVSVVEPSPQQCGILAAGARRFGLEMTIYNGSAEYMDAIDARFDVLCFNRSLHHCDDPARALVNARRLLVAGGTMVAANEMLLPVFRSHAWFRRLLADHPQRMGHDGANEHAYRYGEYVAMIRAAGFADVRAVANVRYGDYDLVMREVGGRGYYSAGRKRLRGIWFYLVSKLFRAGAIGAPAIAVMKRLSMLTTTFLARNP